MGVLNWSPTASTTYSLPAGYYTGGTLDSSNAYNSGYNIGYTDGVASASSTSSNVDVTYTYRHTHCSSCYSYPDAHYVEYYEKGDDGGERAHICTITCSACGKYWRVAHRTSTSDAQRSISEAWALANSSGHIQNGKCYSASPTLSCGKSAAEYTTTNVSDLIAGDSVISATIVY